MELIGYTDRVRLKPSVIKYFEEEERALGVPITVIWGNSTAMDRPKDKKGIVIIDWGIPADHPVHVEKNVLGSARRSDYTNNNLVLKNAYFLQAVEGYESYDRKPSGLRAEPVIYAQIAKDTIWTLVSLNNFRGQEVKRLLKEAIRNSRRAATSPLQISSSADSKKFKAELLASLMENRTQALEEKRNQMRDRQTQLAAYEQQLLQWDNEVVELTQQIQDLEKDDRSYSKSVQSILEELNNNPYLKEIKLSHTTLIFKTNELYLYNMQRTMRVPLGEFRIKLHTTDRAVTVCNTTRFWEWPGYGDGYGLHHPHAPGYKGQDNTPCWGNYRQYITPYLRKKDYGGFFSSVVKFLEMYRTDHECPWFKYPEYSELSQYKVKEDGEILWLTYKEKEARAKAKSGLVKSVKAKTYARTSNRRVSGRTR